MKIKKLFHIKITTHSISFKIWSIMALTLCLLLAFILLINMTILRKIKDEFIFGELEKAAIAKRSTENTFEVPSSEYAFSLMDEKESFSVAHFRMEKRDKQFSLLIDQFTNSLYMHSKKNHRVIERIAQRISTQKSDHKFGILKDAAVWHYYYVDWDSHGSSAMVFLTSTNKESVFSFRILGIIGILLMISFFAASITAKKLSKPIEELEIFAGEVSKRNWNAKAPKTEPDEIGHLGAVLENMRDALKIAEERDRQFLQSTSHDLKTPVMIIKGYAQAMLDGVSVYSKESIAEVIVTESTRLERKITQLLRLHTLGHALSYSENRDVIRLDRILKSLASKFSIIRPDLRLDLQLTPLEILGDSEALLVAFENIIENQLRYAKTIISISLTKPQTIKADRDKMIQVIIFNDGPPFEFENPLELFDAYKKDKTGKFGLGLAIVKQVIEAHSGMITASNTDEGVMFKILLPEFNNPIN